MHVYINIGQVYLVDYAHKPQNAIIIQNSVQGEVKEFGVEQFFTLRPFP